MGREGSKWRLCAINRLIASAFLDINGTFSTAGGCNAQPISTIVAICLKTGIAICSTCVSYLRLSYQPKTCPPKLHALIPASDRSPSILRKIGDKLIRILLLWRAVMTY